MNRRSHLERKYYCENAYRPKQIRLNNRTLEDDEEGFRSTSTVTDEYVFICVVTRNHEEARVLYVSKEYRYSIIDVEENLSNEEIAVRFVFYSPYHGDLLRVIAIAEEPAQAYIDPNFNVEIYYLEIRKCHQPGIFTYITDLTPKWIFNN